ncbi:MAG: DegQ family serine endoprotease [Deltaproteobacteria bacterium]|nr:DegQ family serine endoprotease [Deltaproteobacteria bacterium]
MRIRHVKVAALSLASVGIGFGLSSLTDSGVVWAKKDGPLWTEKSKVNRLPPDSPVTLSSFAKLAKEVSSAVVNISTVSRARQRFSGPHRDPFQDFFRRFMPRMPENRGVGTGFIIHPAGYILTNNHVIDGADEIRVKMVNDQEFRAKLVGADSRTDVALLKVAAKGDLPVIALGDSEKLEIGEWVIAIGNPFGLSHTVTAGIVSAKGRREVQPSSRHQYSDFIQTDASINPGNSGGPLININGEVVGINTAIHAAGQGIGFAIPINMAKVLVPQLKDRGKVVRSWIGVHIQEVTADLASSFGLDKAQGALLAQVVPGGPGDKAGLKQGDIVVAFKGKPIQKASDLPWLASTAGPGEKIDLKVVRQGQPLDLAVTLGVHPEDEPAKAFVRGSGAGRGDGATGDSAGTHVLGLELTTLPAERARELGFPNATGVVVTKVTEGGEADEAGVEMNDVIFRVNDTPIPNAEGFKKMIDALGKGQVVRLFIRRGEASMFIAFRKR